MGERRTKLCFPFYGDLIGGSHIPVLGLLCNLDRRRFDPVVLVKESSGEIAQLMRGADVEVAATGPLAALRHGERAMALAEGALDLLNDRVRHAALAAAAHEYAPRHFGADRHAQAVMALYDELVAGPRNGRPVAAQPVAQT